jgi:ATP-binding cassette subfamily F protein 3
MSIAMHLDGVSLTYVSEPVFENLSWEIHDDRCVGLVGPNGCGKSTLLRLIAGELASDTGYRIPRKGLSIGYLPQEPRLAAGRSVWHEALTASTRLAQIEADLAQVEARLADPAVYGDGKALARALERQSGLLAEYDQAGGPGYERRVRATLHSLGFGDADLNLPVEAMSGGQKKLVGLAKLLVTQPDLLLLDEPDNHLDLAGKAFLEQFLNSYKGAVIIVSHDRYLLDMVADEIADLEGGRLTHYGGAYSEYVVEKQARLLRQQQLYQAQQKEISRLEQAAKRLMTWGKVYDNPDLARRGQSIMRRLERMDTIEAPTLERRRMGLDLAGWRGSDKVLEIRNLEKAFPAAPAGSGADGDETIVPRPARRSRGGLAGLDLLIRQGERVGLVGPNGSGKSLLFRLILGQEQPSGGQISIGPSLKLGYYAQEHEVLDYQRSLIDSLRQVAAVSETEAVRFLGRFLFSYEQARGRVAELSGGERSRLQMALLMLSNPNFLLLDEPTNNLDIASAEVLEEALADFRGTVLVISHDRYFLDRVVQRILELDEGTLAEYLGGYSDYQAARAVS